MSVRAINTVKAGIAAFVVAVALVGCGGGSDSAGVPTTGGQQGQQGQVGEAEQVGTATLSWVAPGSRVNGEQMSTQEIDGFRVLYGKSAAELDQVSEVSACLSCTLTLSGLDEGTWYFAVQTVDSDGLVSEPSRTVSKSI